VTALLPSDPDARATGIGGSDVAMILGVSRFGSAMRVYLEKRRQVAPLIETSRMRWGKILEEPVAREYEVQSGRKVRRAAAFIRHPDYPWAFANIDRWSDLKGTPRRVLEVKTADVFSRSDFGEKGTDQVPPDYLLQVMWYLFVTGKDEADMAVLVGGNDFGIYLIKRDDALITKMLTICAAFWEDTQAGTPPEVDDTDASAAYLRLTYRDSGAEREMDDDLMALAMRDENLRLALDQQAKERDLVRNQIRELMGDARFAVGAGVKVTHSEVAGARVIDWPAIVAAVKVPPSVIEAHTKHRAPTRQLRVSLKGIEA